METGLGKGYGQGQSDISQTEYSESGFLVFQFVDELLHRHSSGYLKVEKH
jgi:hypothetical protein